MKSVYIIFLGELGSDSYFYSVYNKKKKAIRDMYASGYIYNKEQDIYINDKSGRYCKIKKHELNIL